MFSNSLTRTDPSERSFRTGSRDPRQALVGKNVGATILHEVSAAFTRRKLDGTAAADLSSPFQQSGKD